MGVGPTTQDFVSENETNESPDAYYGSEENQYNVEGANTSAQDIVVSNNTTLDNYDYSNNRGYDPGQGSLQVQNGYQQQSDVLSCNYQTTTVVHAPKTALQVIYDEIDLLFAAGEITEAESAELHQLAFQGDLRVRDAIAQHSQGNSSLLVSLLHRDNDNLDLLYQRDMQYATYVQQTTQNYYNAPEVQPQAVYTYSSLYSYNQNPPQVVPAGVNPSNSIPNYTNATASSLQFNSTLPPLFYCDTFLCGLILKQTQTKLVFKKWKHCVFMLIPNALQLYQTLNDWKFRRAVYWSLPIHRCLVRIVEFSRSVDDWPGDEQAARSNTAVCYRYYRREQRYCRDGLLIVGQKTVRLASSYEYVVTILREKMMEYISSSYLFICCTKACGLDCDGL